VKIIFQHSFLVVTSFLLKARFTAGRISISAQLILPKSRTRTAKATRLRRSKQGKILRVYLLLKCLFKSYPLNFIPVKNPISRIRKSPLKLIFTQIRPWIPLTRFPRPFLNLNLIWLGVGVTLLQIALIRPPRKIPLSKFPPDPRTFEST
jgi:hypothetical protein